MRNTVGEKYDTTETKEFANPWLLMMFVAVILAEAEFLGITDLTGLNHVATGDHTCGCEALLWFIPAVIIVSCGPFATGALHIATYFIFRSIISDRQRLLLLHYAAVLFYYVLMLLCCYYDVLPVMFDSLACLLACPLYIFLLPWIISVCFSFFFVSFCKGKNDICSNINRIFAKIVRFLWFFTTISLPVAVFVKYML